jgi:hypothetical protein
MRCFTLHRIDDETGVSGTGVVAWGVEWPDGSVSMRWLGKTPSFVNYEGGVEHVRAVHGHHGKTVINFKECNACLGEAACQEDP